jgi:nucleoside-diphosphate-sugar epimerase
MKECQVLVVGAGYTGSRLLDRLPAASAVGTTRKSTGRTQQRMLEIDLDNATPQLPAAQSIVYTVPPDGRPTDQRLANLLRGIRTMPARLVYLSTTGIYGDHGGAVVDENSKPDPQTARAERRIAAERQLTAWCRQQAVELTILRVPGIYGPDRLRLERIEDGEAILREADAGPANRIHVDDLVSCLLAAIDPDRPAGVYNVGDGDHRSSSWFARTTAELAGLPAPPEVSMEVAQRTFGDMRLSFMNESRRVDVRRMREVLRVTLAYPDARDGILASLPARYRSSGDN